MHIPGLVTVTDETPDELERAIRIIGTSFMEEPWFVTWLSALDELGATEQRKAEILHAVIDDDLRAHVPYEGVYVLEDGAAATGAYRHSELRGTTHAALEDGPAPAFDAIATPEEKRVLAARSEAMAPISDFDWSRKLEKEADHIYFFAWAVDPAARGTGALRRLLEPFFAYADEHGLNCYLECYSDHLQSMYEHFGFELIDVLSCEDFDVTERRMVRRCNS